jgi:pteridine reductase
MPLALITGAGRRMGTVTARALAREGFDLALHANRSRDSLDTFAQEVRSLGRKAWTYAADLADPEAVARFADAVRADHTSLDLLVHNAGLFEAVPFEKIERAAYRRMQAVNVEAPFFLTQQWLPLLRAANNPLVVHMADIAGDRPLPGYAHYSVSKASLIMLTRALAVELAPKVRVNAIAPGTVAFPENFDAATRERFLERIPMRREGSFDDIAQAIVFLAKHAPYVTGQVLAIDGGRSVSL